MTHNHDWTTLLHSVSHHPGVLASPIASSGNNHDRTTLLHSVSHHTVFWRALPPLAASNHDRQHTATLRLAPSRCFGEPYTSSDK